MEVKAPRPGQPTSVGRRPRAGRNAPSSSRRWRWRSWHRSRCRRTAPADPDGAPIWLLTPRGRHFTTRTHDDWWRQVRAAVGRHQMKFHHLKHFAGWYLLNVLEIRPDSIAHQLAHADTDLLFTSTGTPRRQSPTGRSRRHSPGQARQRPSLAVSRAAPTRTPAPTASRWKPAETSTGCGGSPVETPREPYCEAIVNKPRSF
jgi:hypothetical protein